MHKTAVISNVIKRAISRLAGFSEGTPPDGQQKQRQNRILKVSRDTDKQHVAPLAGTYP